MISTLAPASALLALSLLAAPQNPVPTGPRNDVDPQPRGGNCLFEGASHAMSFTPGTAVENFFVTTGDPDLRRFIVYVPSGYQPDQDPYPVVYMLHGTGQNAATPITKLTWDEAAEAQDFIAVFPEALPYLLTDGTTKTKWATDAVIEHHADPSELPLADDVLFLRELHNTLGNHLNIDCDRIYASGFSNGGAFCKTKIRQHLADVFAATSAAGGLGLQPGDPSEFYPEDGFTFRPHFEVVGDKDANKKDHCVALGDLSLGDHLPLALSDIVATPCMWDNLTTAVEAAGLDSSTYTSVEQTTWTQILWSNTTLPGPEPREYRFRILHNLTHEYPSGANYPVDYVPIYYQWMSQYTR